MKIKLYLIVFFFGVLLTQNSLKGQQAYSQNEFSKDQNDSTRKVYVYAGVGLFEWFNLGIGFQINPEFSVSLKHANTWVSGHGGSYVFPSYASGIGLEIKYFKDLWIFNNVSFSYIYYLYVPNIYDDRYGIQPKGDYYEINFGNESIKKGVKRKIQIFWSVGLGKSYNKNYDKTLIMPSIKIGIFHNLF